MGFADQVSTLIFALIVIGVIVYLVMSAYVVGPVSRLKRGEKVILTVGLVIILYAWAELLLHVVF
jgi:preprotein translocase subunit YajC